MTNTVCRYCEKRYVGCHSSCEDYIAEKKAREAEKAEMRKKRVADYQVGELLYGSRAKRRLDYLMAGKRRGNAVSGKK